MAVGTVVLTQQFTEGPVRSAVITATGSSTDGTFPATTLNALGIQLIQTGGTLLALATNPGSTAPTANYDVTLVDGDGLDRLNGVGVDRHTSNSERVAVSGMAFVAQGEVLTLTIANNSVNSAVTVITLYWTTMSAVAVLPSAGVGGSTPAVLAAAHQSSTQVVPTTVTGTLAVARATRVRCTIINHGNLPVQYGETTATTTMAALNPGEGITLGTPALIAGILATGTFAGKVEVIDEYN